MEYKALSLKYRPQALDEIVGQETVVRGLKAAIEKKSIHHAYLFSGPRGVGKTSTARILAKSLNCVQGPVISPCGVCNNCKEIREGRNIDVIEIDGASNRGIDEVRTLRENVKFAPVNSRYKIYIIDEVHMLTEPAFNALLKTLEEPPEHVRFLLATTHVHKLPPTILSRCQKYSFSLVSSALIVERLKRIAAAEQVSIPDPKVLYGVAKASGGSIRDAESIFDQILPIVSDPDFVKQMYSFLGIIEESMLSAMAAYIAQRDAAKALRLIDRLFSEGKDLSEFARDFIEYLRNILLIRIDKSFLEKMELSPESKETLSRLAAAFSEQALIAAIEEFVDAHRKAKAINSLRIPLELALIKLCGAAGSEKPAGELRPAESAKVQVSESKPATRIIPPASAPKPSVPSSPTIARTPFKNESPVGAEGIIAPPVRKASIIGAPAVKEAVIVAEEETPVPVLDEAFVDELKKKWGELAAQIKGKSILLGSYFQKADVCSVNANVVTCSFPQNLSFHKEHLEDKENIKTLELLLKEFLHRDVRLKFVLGPAKDASMEAYTRSKKTTEADTPDVRVVNDIINEFQGKIIKEDA